jgi:hypothetical protein
MDNDTDRLERYKLENRLEELSGELTELRLLVAQLADIFALRQRGLYTEAITLIDELQRNWAALMRDRYPDPRP